MIKNFYQPFFFFWSFCFYFWVRWGTKVRHVILSIIFLFVCLFLGLDAITVECWFRYLFHLFLSDLGTKWYNTYRYVGTGWPWAMHGNVVCPFSTTCRNECFSTLMRGCTKPFGSVTIIRPGYVDTWISPVMVKETQWFVINLFGSINSKPSISKCNRNFLFSAQVKCFDNLRIIGTGRQR